MMQITPLPVGSPIHAGKPALYLVHSVKGAGAQEFRHLAELVQPDLQLYALDVPMRERNKASASSLVAMADAYRSQVLSHYHSHYHGAPLLLGGWSAGVILALEMAQRLTDRDRPFLLIAIDKCPRYTRAEIGPWNGTARNIRLWFRRSWRNSNTTSQAVRSLLHKAWISVRTRQLYGGPDAEYDSLAVVNALKYLAKSNDERDFIENFYAQTADYVPQRYNGHVLVIVTDDGYRDRVIEGWREIAPQRKVVRLRHTTHRNVMYGNSLGFGGDTDLTPVQLLASTLRREVAAARCRPVT